MKTTIVIPTYNEKENLPLLMEKVFGLGMDGLNVLIVDDNSPDGTGALAEELREKCDQRIHVMHRKGKLGLGTAYIQGFQWALENGSDFIGQMDADFSHPIDKIPLLAEELKTYDVAIGSRYVKGGKLDEEWPLFRKLLSGFGNLYARTILGLTIHDATGGYKLWRRETLEAMPLDRIKANGYMFQVEMNFVATRLGFKFTEIPIYFRERVAGASKMNFAIQREAAVRCWKLRSEYRDLKKIK